MAAPMAQARSAFCRLCCYNVSRVPLITDSSCDLQCFQRRLFFRGNSNIQRQSYLRTVGYTSHQRCCCIPAPGLNNCQNTHNPLLVAPLPKVFNCRTLFNLSCKLNNNHVINGQTKGLTVLKLRFEQVNNDFESHPQRQRFHGCSRFNADAKKGESSRKDEILEKQRKFKAAFKSKVADLTEDIKTIPNLLTLLRMLSAPVLGTLIIYEQFTWALGLFVFAGITDLMDGYIARNFKNQMSVLGTMMDPLADKLLMTVLALTLTAVDLIPVPLVVLIVSRDIGLIGAAFYIRYQSLPPPKTMLRYFDVTLPTAKLYPSNLSKVNTALQLSLVALTLAAPVFHYVDHPYLQALWYITALTTFTSGAQYVISSKNFFKILQQKTVKDKNNMKPPKR